MRRQIGYPARIVILSELREPKDLFSMCQRPSSCPPFRGSLCSPAESLRTLPLCVRSFFPLPLADFLFHLTGFPLVTSLPKASAKGHASSVVRGSSPVTRHESLVTNSFICHTSEETAHKSFACHTSKNPLPQVLCLPHIQDPPRGPPGPAPRRHARPSSRAVIPSRHPEPQARDLLCLSLLSFAFVFRFCLSLLSFAFVFRFVFRFCLSLLSFAFVLTSLPRCFFTSFSR